MNSPLKSNFPILIDDATAEIPQYLVFHLNGSHLAFSIHNLKEIIHYDQLTEVPLMPAELRGVINLRGAAVPVIDLSTRLWNRRTEPGKRTCIVIMELDDDSEPQVMGVIVDAVSQVVEIPHVDIEPPPAFGSVIHTDFIAGMGKLDGRFIVILNARRALYTDPLAALAGNPPLLPQRAESVCVR